MEMIAMSIVPMLFLLLWLAVIYYAVNLVGVSSSPPSGSPRRSSASVRTPGTGQ